MIRNFTLAALSLAILGAAAFLLATAAQQSRVAAGAQAPIAAPITATPAPTHFEGQAIAQTLTLPGRNRAIIVTRDDDGTRLFLTENSRATWRSAPIAASQQFMDIWADASGTPGTLPIYAAWLKSDTETVLRRYELRGDSLILTEIAENSPLAAGHTEVWDGTSDTEIARPLLAAAAGA